MAAAANAVCKAPISSPYVHHQPKTITLKTHLPLLSSASTTSTHVTSPVVSDSANTLTSSSVILKALGRTPRSMLAQLSITSSGWVRGE